MSLLLSLTLFVGQIEAGPPPEHDAELLRINVMLGSGMRGSAPKSKPFPIARYLNAAEQLQNAPEKERVLWLRMAARSDALEEPAVLMALLLIVPKEGESFRCLADGSGWGERFNDSRFGDLADDEEWKLASALLLLQERAILCGWQWRRTGGFS